MVNKEKRAEGKEEGRVGEGKGGVKGELKGAIGKEEMGWEKREREREEGVINR